MNRVSEELWRNRGQIRDRVGWHLPAEYHALALAMNAALGAIGATLTVLKESGRRSHDAF